MRDRPVAVVRRRRSSRSASLVRQRRTRPLATCDQWNGPRGTDCGRSSSVERVVQRGRAQPIAQRRIGRVAAGARIDEQRHAADREGERQRVGVRVTAVLIAVRSAVDDEMIAGRRARDVVARVRQRRRRDGCGAADGRRVRPAANVAMREQPQRFFRRAADRAAPDDRRARPPTARLSRRSSGSRPVIGISAPPSSSPMCGTRPRSSASRRAADRQPRDRAFELGAPPGRR